MRFLAPLFALALLPCEAHAQAQTFDWAYTATPTVQNASYSAGNALGGLQTMPILRLGQRSAIIDNFLLTSVGGSASATVTVYIFDTKPASACTDKSGFTLGAADVPFLAMQPFTLTPAAPTSGGTPTFAQQSMTISVRNNDNPATNNLYMCMVAAGTFTPASTTDLVYKIAAAQD